jgi:DNA invertase Pin-like site-specific DNA recombinase
MEYDIQILHSYLRMSTPEQRLGRSERRQVDKMCEWTLERGAAFDDTYQDFGVSAFYGSHRRHGALGRFLDAVRTGQLSPKGRALGIESFDRLTREHSWDADTLLHEIIDSGITVVIESLGFLILTRERMLREPHLQHLLISEMTRARAESERKQEMSLDNRAAERREARMTKRPVTARCPPWLSLPRQEGTKAERVQQRANREWIVNCERKRVVILIFEMVAAGFSASDIANHLNATDVATFTGTPCWRRHQVQWILANEAVLGVYVPGHYVEDRNRRKGRRRVCDTEGVEGYYPAIISEDLWRRARRVVEGHSQSGRGRKGIALTNLVSGLGYCEVCGSKLHYGNGYLRCSLSIQRQACTNNIGFPYARLEALLMALGDLSGSVANLMPQTTQPNTAKQIVAELEAEIARKSEAMVQMVRDYASKAGAQAKAAMVVQDELNANIARLKQRLVEARDQLSRSGPDERKGFLARFKAARALLDSDNPQEQRDSRIRLSQEFHRLIEGIVLHPAKQRSPNRFVTVHLKPDADGLRCTYAFSPQTVVGIHGQLPDGRTALIGPSVLRQMPSIMRFSDDDDGLSKAELIARSVAGVLKVNITYDGSGNHQVIAAEQDPGPLAKFAASWGRIAWPGEQP